MLSHLDYARAAMKKSYRGSVSFLVDPRQTGNHKIWDGQKKGGCIRGRANQCDW